MPLLVSKKAKAVTRMPLLVSKKAKAVTREPLFVSKKAKAVTQEPILVSWGSMLDLQLSITQLQAMFGNKQIPIVVSFENHFLQALLLPNNLLIQSNFSFAFHMLICFAQKKDTQYFILFT